jgi:hypothetical protein
MRFVTNKDEEAAKREQILREERERNERIAAEEQARVDRQRGTKKDK